MNPHNFSNILVPEDIFAFVRAMDEVLEAVDGFKDKIQSEQKFNKKKLKINLKIIFQPNPKPTTQITNKE